MKIDLNVIKSILFKKFFPENKNNPNLSNFIKFGVKIISLS